METGGEVRRLADDPASRLSLGDSPPNRFFGFSLTFDNETLPRSNKGGCVGFLVGQYGSHKTGTAIMLGLEAIERHDARVLFIASEDANGVAKVRLPAACKARNLRLEKVNPHWRTETETFDLLSEKDRADLIEAYRNWPPDLIFIDVLTRVIVADIYAPETGMRIMQAVYALAAPFRATVVISHHLGLSGGGRPMGSSLFRSLADFCLKASHKGGVVSTSVEKMKNGPDGFTVSYQTELFERYQRSERALVAALTEMYVQGVSTRKSLPSRKRGSRRSPRSCAATAFRLPQLAPSTSGWTRAWRNSPADHWLKPSPI